METKVHHPGKLAYENQLIKQHRREIKAFLIRLREYTPYQIQFIMDFYDKNINKDNILKVHTHSTQKFLQALCTGKLETLYTFTSSKNLNHA